MSPPSSRCQFDSGYLHLNFDITTKEEALNVIKELQKLVEERIEYKNYIWRRGQTYFNLVYHLYPDIANKIRNTENDCFYNDYKIYAFLDNVLHLLMELPR